MNWQVEVTVDNLDPDGYYFLANRWESMGRVNYLYWSRGLNGKESWTSKPGIAIHIRGNDQFVKLLKSNPKFVALKIPEDHAKRWKARKHRIKPRR